MKMPENMDKLVVAFALLIHVCSPLIISPATNTTDDLDIPPDPLASHIPHPLGPPYLDANRICRDRLEMMETIEYEDEIHCQVKMKETCEEKDESFEKACHTVYKKECQISYRPQMSKVKVRVCPGDNVERVDEESASESANSVVIDIRPTPSPSPPLGKSRSRCVDNQREICVTKFETECHTEMKKHEMAEDRPRCRVELIESCSHGCKASDPDCSLFERSKCERVPAMRCRIERQMVTKTKPVSKCERVPRRFCRIEKCGEAKAKNLQEECYFRIQTINEAIPETNCHLYPHRMCHDVRRRKRKFLRKSRNLDSSASSRLNEPMRCKFEPEELCRTRKVNPRPVTKPMRRKMCRLPKSKADFKILEEILRQQEEYQKRGP